VLKAVSVLETPLELTMKVCCRILCLEIHLLSSLNLKHHSALNPTTSESSTQNKQPQFPASVNSFPGKGLFMAPTTPQIPLLCLAISQPILEVVSKIKVF
jgi:hypothetical protein